jgi:hypothetical protein
VSEQNHEKVGRSHETDFGDPRVTEAWLVEVDPDLDESDRQALVQEISRQFRLSPAGVPASGLESELVKTQDRLSWVLQTLETQESPVVRSQVSQLRERFAKDIEALKIRVGKMQIDDPHAGR